MKMPSFSRQSGTTTDHDERPTLVDGIAVPPQHRADDASAVPMRTRDDETTERSLGARLAATSAPADRAVADRTDADRTDADRTAADRNQSDRSFTDRTDTDRTAADRTAADRTAADRTAADRAAADRAATHRSVTDDESHPDRTPGVSGPKPRASLLATLGLITAIVSALMVLSGPLAGYGVGLAVLALLLSFGGIRATRRRHVAGKTDALIGLLVSLGAIVVGMLALSGSLPWLGTDMESASRLREWLDARFVNLF